MQSAAARSQSCQPSCSWQTPGWEGFLKLGSAHLRKLPTWTSLHTRQTATRKCGTLQVEALLFDPPPFDQSKLSIIHLPCSLLQGAHPPKRRRYTLTHNDITGDLLLSIGTMYNTSQLNGWYVKLIRDEVLAEWHYCSEGRASLHVHCHVSGEERWIASPQLRNYIFQREMPLVLETIRHAEQDLLRAFPQLAVAPVFVHLSSHLAEFHTTLEWGPLGQPEAWRRPPRSLWQDFLQAFSEGFPLPVLLQGVEGGAGQQQAQSVGHSGLAGGPPPVSVLTGGATVGDPAREGQYSLTCVATRAVVDGVESSVVVCEAGYPEVGSHTEAGPPSPPAGARQVGEVVVCDTDDIPRFASEVPDGQRTGPDGVQRRQVHRDPAGSAVLATQQHGMLVPPTGPDAGSPGPKHDRTPVGQGALFPGRGPPGEGLKRGHWPAPSRVALARDEFTVALSRAAVDSEDASPMSFQGNLWLGRPRCLGECGAVPGNPVVQQALQTRAPVT
eukprot:jgi/Botrbrau1/4421/Bobra.0348s0011.1